MHRTVYVGYFTTCWPCVFFYLGNYIREEFIFLDLGSVADYCSYTSLITPFPDFYRSGFTDIWLSFTVLYYEDLLSRNNILPPDLPPIRGSRSSTRVTWATSCCSHVGTELGPTDSCHHFPQEHLGSLATPRHSRTSYRAHMQPVVGIMFERCSVGRWIYPLANGQPLALYNKMEGMVGYCIPAAVRMGPPCTVGVDFYNGRLLQ